MNAPTKDYPFTSVDIDRALLVAIAENLIHQHVPYTYGSKAKPLDVDSHSFRGTLGKGIDCSGFTRYDLNKCGFLIPDGSVNQRQFFESHGFKPTTQIGELDGRVRIAFLKPEDTHGGIGHVMLVYMGKTLESHGGVGVDRRIWGSSAFMRDCVGFVIDPRQIKI